MKPTLKIIRLAITIFTAFLGLLSQKSHAQGDVITYQGRLTDGGVPANGNYDLRFAIYDLDSGGTAVGGPITNAPTAVSNGLFAVSLNFGPGVFTGNPRWLEIGVRTNGGAAYTNVEPRQSISASPYAILAGNISGTIGTTQLADGSVTTSKLATGAVGSAQLGTNVIQATNIAPGVIGSTQLAKPPQSGSILSSSLNIYFNQAFFPVTFNPAFATTPNVTFSLETTNTALGSQSTMFVQQKSTTSFTGYLRLPTTPIIVDNTNFCGRSSLAVVSGSPAISYSASGQLNFITTSDVNGGAWSIPFTVDNVGNQGEFNSLAVVNGNPAIAYYAGSPNLNLKYVRATSVNGGSWGTPVTIDSTGDVGQYTSLAIIGGNPAISYYDNTGDNLKYVRSSDVGGTNWNTPVNVDTAGNAGFGNSLAVVNGNPAISYGSSPGGLAVLKYVRASDTNGVAWPAPITVDTNGSFVDTSLAVVSGNPAICYSDLVNGRLRYVRSTDAGGTNWGTPVTVDANTLGLSSSLAVISGNPAISYLDTVNGDLKYVRANDANGTSWGTPVTIDFVGDVGAFTTLKIVNGEPAISYLDQTTGFLKFIRQQTPTTPFSINWIALEP